MARYVISLPAGEAGRRRTPEERLFVRFPGLYRRLAGQLMRLPPGSRLRRWTLIRVGVRSLAAANRRDFDVLLLGMDPEIEYRPSPTQIPPGMDPVVHGHVGYRRVWEQMMDAFQDFRGEPKELFDLGDRLLAAVEYRGHGTGSGVPIVLPVFQLFRLRRGLVIRQQDFADRAEALAAAGIRG